ncbi:MAG: amidohydrolase family protein, partial [Alphaproteobacteria bacterium]
MTALFCPEALLPEGWARHVRVDIDAEGTIVAVSPGAPATGAERAGGPVIPGMPNLHSHAFQRAMAGLTERLGTGGAGGAGGDSFWTWREVMYGFVRTIGPEALEAIAAQLYVEMLSAGYTAVAEFHYLHHDPNGAPYGDRAELSRRVIAAARHAGIGITHLPVLYAHGGFGAKPPATGQRRFVTDGPGFLRLTETVAHDHRNNPEVRVGIAPHSLRAVAPDLLGDVIAGLDAIDAAAPIHIHIAEQEREVEKCL